MLSFSDMPRPFTFNEESGELSRSIGLIPHLLHNPGRRQYPHWHVLHHHPLPKK